MQKMGLRREKERPGEGRDAEEFRSVLGRSWCPSEVHRCWSEISGLTEIGRLNSWNSARDGNGQRCNGCISWITIIPDVELKGSGETDLCFWTIGERKNCRNWRTGGNGKNVDQKLNCNRTHRCETTRVQEIFDLKKEMSIVSFHWKRDEDFVSHLHSHGVPSVRNQSGKSGYLQSTRTSTLNGS